MDETSKAVAGRSTSFRPCLCSDPKKLDRKVARCIKLMPQGFEFGRGQVIEG
jgi:hypothetical protein